MNQPPSESDTPLSGSDLLRSMPQALLVLNDDLRVVQASESYCDMFQTKHDEIVGQMFFEMGCGQWDVPELCEKLKELLKDGLAFRNFRVEQEFPEIGRRVMHLQAVRVRRSGEADQLVIVAVEDRTEEVEARRELTADREWLRVTLQSIGDAVIVTDEKSHITLMNPVAEKLLGRSREECKNRSLIDVFQIIDEATRKPVENPAKRALQNNEIVGLTNHTLLIREDGSEVSIADSAAPIRDVDGTILGVVLVFRDVTESRNAEIAIRDARQFAENIVDTIRQPLLVLNSDLRVMSANRSFYHAFRVSQSKTEGELIYQLGNGQWDIPLLRKLLNEILPENSSFEDFDVEHEFPTIGRRHMKLNARRMHQEQDHSELILLAIEDMTDQYEADRARRIVENRFGTLVKNIRDHAIFTIDPDGLITTWNHEAENILGLTEKEAIGTHFRVIFTDEEKEQGFPELELQHASDLGRAEDERWHVRKDGEKFWAQGIVTPLRDETGELFGYSKILRDMTDRKRAEESLQLKSAQLQMLWDAAAVLLTAENPERMIQRIYERLQQHLNVDAYFMFVADEDENLTLSAADGITPEQIELVKRAEFSETVCSLAAEERRAISIDHVQQATETYTTLVRSLGFRAYSSSPMLYENRLIGALSFATSSRDTFSPEELSLFQTICHYVTVAYVRLRLVQELRETHRRKDEFLAMLAHELRNPLAPIRSGLDVLSMTDSGQGEVVELLQAQVNHVVRLVDDLMDVSRIMRGKVELRKAPVDLVELIEQSLDAVRPVACQQNQDLSVSLPQQPVIVHADSVRIMQALENLLNNACKYTEEGGRIQLRLTIQGVLAEVEVQDNGIGMDPEILPVVFDLFTQSKRSLDRSQGGLGIGLTLVKNLIDLHDGTVTAFSEGLGKGSTFTVRLPLAESGLQEIAPADSPAAARSQRILVVDDNVGAARMLTMLLQKLGDHEVQTAHDGLSAIDAFNNFKPDIILLDIGLPGVDGYEVARRIRRLPEGDRVHLIALTGYGQDRDRELSRQAGLDEHLVKPPSLDQIREVLRSGRQTP